MEQENPTEEVGEAKNDGCATEGVVGRVGGGRRRHPFGRCSTCSQMGQAVPHTHGTVSRNGGRQWTTPASEKEDEDEDEQERSLR